MICSTSEFIAAWNASGTLAEVVEATGLKNSSARRRACNLRKRGHDLPYMRPNAARDVLKTGDRVRRGRAEGSVVMSEHATGLCVIAWDGGGTDTATRRGAIYVERIK